MSAETQEQTEARIKELLDHPDFRHISRRHGLLCFYKKDKSSPTGCQLIGGCEDNSINENLIRKYRKPICQGGLMGNSPINA